MKKYSYYHYETGVMESDKYVYTILCDVGDIESDEWYDTEFEADEAARKHIDNLENGEG